MYTETGEPIEAVTTLIAKGMRQVIKLEPAMRARADTAIFGEIRNILIDHRVMAGVYQSDILPGGEELTVGLLVEDK